MVFNGYTQFVLLRSCRQTRFHQDYEHSDGRRPSSMLLVITIGAATAEKQFRPVAEHGLLSNSIPVKNNV